MSPRRNLRRFEHLERARPARPPSGDGAGRDSARFESLEAEPQPTAPGAPASGATLNRFEAPAERPLALLEKREVDQPFTRCMHCEADNSRYVEECERCHQRLDTPEQRAFNEALWSERQVYRAEEQERLAQATAVRDQAIAEEAAANRAYYEALARQVAQQTRDRLDEPVGFLGRRRRVQLLDPRIELGLFVVVAVVVCLALLFVGGFGALLKFLPLLLVLGGIAAFQWWVRR